MPLVMEPIPELNKNFARIQIVGCAKGEAVVEQDPAIGDCPPACRIFR